MAHRDVCQQHVIVVFGESDRCGGELSVLLWVFHHRDLHIQVSSSVVLGLHKHLLWGAHPQEVRCRHHIAEGSELTGQRNTNTFFYIYFFKCYCFYFAYTSATCACICISSIFLCKFFFYFIF